MARNFPEEVIMEILSRLPVKSLMRFKCVSKPWLHLISTDPHFMKLHFNRSKPGILVGRNAPGKGTQFYYAEEYTTCNELTRFEIPFSNPSDPGSIIDYIVINVCNGLLCLTDSDDDDDSNVYVWNPLTRHHITLPTPPVQSLYIGYEVMYGFGFNQASDEYKVIRFVLTPIHEQIDHQCLTHVSVYTLGSDSSWRNLEPFVPYASSFINTSSTAFVNGALHWFGTKLVVSDATYSIETLIAFNMQDENFQEIPLPVHMTRDYPSNTSVGELGGLLSIFCSLPPKYLEIWVMERYGVADSWRSLYRIGQPNVSGRNFAPLGVADNGEIIISISENRKEWSSYDPKTNSVRDLPKFEFPVFHARTFKGSLLSPTIINNYQWSQQSQPLV